MKKVRDPYWTYLREEEKELCRKFFIDLSEALKNDYEVMASRARKDGVFGCSIYLCPKGTTNQVTYHSKPEHSFRFSDHWNWYTSFKKNPDPKYIQCYTRHLPDPKRRPGVGMPSDPIIANCVGLFINGQYRIVYGSKYDRKAKEWIWVDNTIEDVVAKVTGSSAA